jgi:hypothetical protein
MVRPVRLRQFDDDPDDYDPRYFPRKVFKDGRGPRVHLMLTDSASRQPVYDAHARAREHSGCLTATGSRIGRLRRTVRMRRRRA